jgi:hypothetical protein
MTVNEVKQELPMVRIRWNGKHWWGRVSGRLNRFATVCPWQAIDKRKLVTTIIGPCIEFAWETVTRAVNSDTELHAD